MANAIYFLIQVLHKSLVFLSLKYRVKVKYVTFMAELSLKPLKPHDFFFLKKEANV